MPKAKTRKTSVKRFRITGKGKIFRSHGCTSHLRASESGSAHSRKMHDSEVKGRYKVKIKRLLSK